MSTIELAVAGVSFRTVFEDDSQGDAEKSLKIFRRARKAGLRNDPASDTQALSSDEREIVAYFEGYTSKYRDQGLYATNYLNSFIDNMEHDLTPIRMEQLVEDAKSSVSEHRTGTYETLKDAFRRRDVARRRLSFFETENNLTRDAHFPESRVLQVAIIFGLILGESLANSYFFSIGSGLGLVGGWLEATLLSTVNVIFSFVFIGYISLRYLNHVNTNYRLLAVVGLSLVLIFLTLINGVAAHYRDMLEQQQTVQFVAAFQHFVNGPFDIAGFDALLLFIIGILSSAVAAYEGYTLDDPYPGYGALKRQLNLEDKRYYLEREHHVNELSKVIRTGLDRIDGNADKARDSLKSFRDARDLFSQIEAAYPQYCKARQDECNTVLARYREENRSVRSDPAPASFEVYPNIIPDAPFPTLTPVADKIDQIAQDFGEIESVRTESKRHFREYFENLIAEWETYLERLEAFVVSDRVGQQSK